MKQQYRQNRNALVAAAVMLAVLGLVVLRGFL